MKFVKTYEEFKFNSPRPGILTPERETEVEPDTMPVPPPMPDYPPGFNPEEDEEDDVIERPVVDPVPLAEKPKDEKETIREIIARIEKES